jgi:hypothetical protein
VHYITGKTFGAWVRESGLQAGEQIRMKREGSQVIIQRVPASKKVSWAHRLGLVELPDALCPRPAGCQSSATVCSVQMRMDFTTRAMSRSVSLAHDETGAGHHGQELASPPTTEALEALDALVAAAGYAGKHGTPAIQAALAAGAAEDGPARAVCAELPATMPSFLQQGLGLQPWQAHVQPKRRCTGQGGAGGEAEQLMLKQEWQLLQARQAQGAAVGPWQPSFDTQQETAGASAFSLAAWQPADRHVLMFQAIDSMLAEHQWDAEQLPALARFRARYAWLDACGREVVYLQTSQLKAEKSALFSFVAEVGKGFLTQLPAAADEQVPPPADGADPAKLSPAVQLQQVKPFAALSSNPEPGALFVVPASTAAAGASSAPLHDARHLGLEEAASFNLDVLMQTDCVGRATPTMHAIGPAL